MVLLVTWSYTLCAVNLTVLSYQSCYGTTPASADLSSPQDNAIRERWTDFGDFSRIGRTPRNAIAYSEGF